MQRLLIICEGQTEREFCQDVLRPYFLHHGILVEAPLIKSSSRDIVAWKKLRKQITNHYNSDKNSYITTFIDYYGIKDKHQFPNWETVEAEKDKVLAMDILEKALQSDLNLPARHRFIPYVQLHEFEGLLFNNLDVFTDNFTPDELQGQQELETTLADFINPELINNGSTTAPSKRLSRIILGYKKIIYGSLLAQAIGLAAIREKCPRFDAWIQQLTQLPPL